MLSSPDGLSEWFADNVNVVGGVYHIIWDDEEGHARIQSQKQNEMIKYEWLDDERKDTFLEFRIKTDPLTKDNALLVTDFCNSGDEKESRQLWDLLITQLKARLGA